MRFRTDVEGLRAVAILLVLAAHAGVPGLAGGFVGVDVFYVLSGFLISGLLIEELERSERVDLSVFYARRFRRLFPSMALVLVVSGIAGYALLAPSDQARQAIAGAWALLWASNIHFAFGELDYFGDAAETNIFLHTWSLGVEEQFYLLWPLLLIALVRGSGGMARRRRLEFAFGTIFVAGFVVCVAWTELNPLHAFYLMPARAWQFALGALVYLRMAELRDAGAARTVARLGWPGFALLVASALIIDDAMRYPGAWALLPSVGAALVLAGGAVAPRGGVGRLLSLAPMQWIGRISYAWYLWHWPVLLLGATLLDVGEPLGRAGLVAFSGVLAYLTSRLVERPIRGAAALVARPRLAIAGTLAAMIGVNALAVRWHNLAYDWADEPAQRRYRAVRADLPRLYALGCDDWRLTDRVRMCAFGASDARRTAVLLGDSIAAQWAPAIVRAIDGTDWRLIVVTKASCPMVDERIYDGMGRRFVECEQWREDALRQVTALAPDAVILASTFTNVLDAEQWRSGTARVLQVLSPGARRIYVLRSTPVLPFDGPRCLEQRSAVYEAIVRDRSCSAPLTAGRFDDVHRWLVEAAAVVPNATVVDMTDLVCPERRCSAQRDGHVVFRDHQHLTASFAESLAGPLAERIDLVRADGAAVGDGTEAR